MIQQLLASLKEDQSLRKMSSEALAKKFNLSIEDVKKARQLVKLDGVPTEDELEEMDYMSKLLYNRGVDPTQVTPTGFWLKDIKSVAKDKGASVYYSINSKVNQKEEKLDLESIREELVKEVKPKILPSYKESDETLLIYLADTHLGMLVSPDAQFVSGYTKEIFKERLMQTLTLVKPNQKTIIVGLGDMVDSVRGTTSRGGHSLPSNMTDKEMYVTFIEAFKEYFETLSEITPNFSFVSVGEDNHTGSINFLLSKSLELYLNTRFPTIETHVFEKFIGHFKLNSNGVEHTIMVCHGKDEKSLSRGLPKTLNPAVELKITNYMIHNNIPLNTKQVSFIKGDLHMYTSEYSTNGGYRYSNCLSLAMPSAWVQQQTFGNTTSGVTYNIINGTQILEGNLFFS